MPTAVVCAYSSVGTAALEGLLEAGIEVLALYTYAQGADEHWFTPPAVVAQARGIPVHMAPAFNDDGVYGAIRNLRPDFLFSFYFREMIQARFLELPRLGAYNLHGRPLPKDRGRGHECRNPVYLVRGTLKCGICGASMTSASTFRSGRLHRYYRCSTRDKKGKEVCPTVQLPAEVIEAYVVDRIRRVLQDPRMKSTLTAHLYAIGLQAPGGDLAQLWEVLTIDSQQRLIRLMVQEATVDQREGKLSVRMRDLKGLPEAEAAAC